MGKGVLQGVAGHGSTRLLTFKVRGLLHGGPGNERHASQYRPHQERNPPSPGIEVRRAQAADRQRGDAHGEQPPTSLAVAAKEATRPRRAGRAPCTRYAVTPLYSPPTENAMTHLNSSSSHPAAGPICAAVGSRPITSMATVIGAMESSSMRRRPYWSPIWPNTMAPRGRIRDETANPARVVSRDSSPPQKYSRQHGGEVQVQREVAPLNDCRERRDGQGTPRNRLLG